MPTWYRVLKAAKWQGVAPWDLGARPIGWLRLIETAMVIEAQARSGAEGI